MRNDWWERLKKALGTTSSAFVQSSLFQLQAAATLPSTGISEIAVNAALAYIEAVAPADEVQAASAVQMACTHTAAMTVLARLGPGHGTERRVVAMATAADALRKKAERLVTDESAKKWLYYMQIVYAALLRNGPAAEKVILACADEARERPYFEKLLPFLRTTLASGPLIPPTQT